MTKEERVIIFDGICGLCNKAVDILIKLDRHKRFKYTSSQGKHIKTLNIKPNIDSIVYYIEGKPYYKSTAILKILNDLGGLWRITNIFYLLPPFIRDWLYDIIAKYRYRLFGKLKRCRVPNEGEKALFLE